MTHTLLQLLFFVLIVASVLLVYATWEGFRFLLAQEHPAVKNHSVSKDVKKILAEDLSPHQIVGANAFQLYAQMRVNRPDRKFQAVFDAINTPLPKMDGAELIDRILREPAESLKDVKAVEKPLRVFAGNTNPSAIGSRMNPLPTVS